MQNKDDLFKNFYQILQQTTIAPSVSESSRIDEVLLTTEAHTKNKYNNGFDNPTTYTIQTDLFDFPPVILKNPGQETFVLGDLHGNALKLIHFLTMYGVMHFKNPNDYKTLAKLYEGYELKFLHLYGHWNGQKECPTLPAELSDYQIYIYVDSANILHCVTKGEMQPKKELSIQDFLSPTEINSIIAYCNTENNEPHVPCPPIDEKIHTKLIDILAAKGYHFHDNFTSDNNKELLKPIFATFSSVLDNTWIKAGPTILLVGDEKGDRASNDRFTDLLFRKMQKEGLDYKITYSNHGAAYIRAIQSDLLKDKNSSWIKQLDMHPHQMRSFINLKNCIDHQIIDIEEVMNDFEQVYLPHVQLFNYIQREDQFFLCGHGIYDLDDKERCFNFIQKQLHDLPNNDTSALILQKQDKDITLPIFIDKVNEAFQIILQSKKLTKITSRTGNRAVKDTYELAKKHRTEGYNLVYQKPRAIKGCDFIIVDQPPQPEMLKTLKFSANSSGAYVKYNKELYYLNRISSSFSHITANKKHQYPFDKNLTQALAKITKTSDKDTRKQLSVNELESLERIVDNYHHLILDLTLYVYLTKKGRIRVTYKEFCDNFYGGAIRKSTLKPELFGNLYPSIKLALEMNTPLDPESKTKIFSVVDQGGGAIFEKNLSLVEETINTTRKTYPLEWVTWNQLFYPPMMNHPLVYENKKMLYIHGHVGNTNYVDYYDSSITLPPSHIINLDCGNEIGNFDNGISAGPLNVFSTTNLLSWKKTETYDTVLKNCCNETSGRSSKAHSSASFLKKSTVHFQNKIREISQKHYRERIPHALLPFFWDQSKKDKKDKKDKKGRFLGYDFTNNDPNNNNNSDNNNNPNNNR